MTDVIRKVSYFAMDVAEVLQKLADANINVTAVEGVSAGGGRWGAILWVKPQSVNKAAKVLQAV
jgi:hypothetical protein